MKRILTMASGIVLLAGISAFAVDPQRSWNGWGASVTASTTPASITIEQPAGDDVASNGTFASTAYWTTGTLWEAKSGAAYFITAGANTGTMYEVVTQLTTGTTYRVEYTLASIGPTTNNVQALVGNTVGTVRTNNGTFTEDIPFLDGSNTLSFIGKASAASDLTIDNVSIREVPKAAFAEYVTFRVGATDLPVYIAWDCPASVFTNIYATSRAILVDSNAVVSIDRNSCAVPIHTIWYRSASGTPTLNINAH